MRKFVIGFVSLCVVLAAYLLYSRISSSPSIDTGPEVDIIEPASDANAVGFDSDIGKIGDVGLGIVDKAYYVTRNPKTQEIVREFGFEKLLSEARDIWDIEKPYMNVYRRNFKCYLTADKGQVQVETAVGRTTPKDATFTSNVVVHIISGPPSDVKESFIYLDSIIYLSERSRLSTAGPIRFVSEDIRMNGTGLELIYNEQTERLEYFEIKDLESLHIKGSSAAMFSADKAQKDNSQPKTQQPDEPPIVGDTPKAEASTPDTQPQTGQEQGVYYKCTFSKNVLVNSTEQLIFAGDKLCINDIFWSKTSTDQPGEVDANSTDDGQTAAATAEPDRQAADNRSEPNVTAPGQTEPNMPSEQLESIVVTCDSGFVVALRDSARAQEDSSADGVEEGEPGTEVPDEFDNGTGRTRFFTRRIDYNATTGDGIADGLSELTFYVGSASGADANEAPVPVKVTARKGAKFSHTSNKVVFEGDCLVTMPQSGLTQPKDVTFTAPEITVTLPEDKSQKPDMFATGPAELVFYMEDANSTDINQGPVPVTVNAQKQAYFLPASNQIIFEGDSRCTMVREDPNALVKYMLLSEQITVDLPADSNESMSGPATGIKHLTATGDVVRLATTKTAKAGGAFAGQVQDPNKAKLLGGVELKCRKFDYDAVRQEFVATGLGVIKLDNSKAPEPNEPVGRFSMQKPCWAVMDGFDTLTYFVRENRIVADTSSQEKLRMDYIPAIDGRYDEHVSVKAFHVEALLYELPSGKTELSTLTATGGIEYEDKDNQFFGSDLFYDHKTAMLKVKGDTSTPCYYNGVPVRGIIMDIRTGRVEAEIVGPGTLQMNR
ncbi:MAG: hypothetical protein WBC05_13220 [Sedimentisphaerales bacterium]